ncbi:DUF1513 domain-containing protein [Paraglaciecola aquimarina]|uniref:DUF1513 domain-containing protein n=1 Tax=Paraglaciecola aquimarina TaxID=1235557 RepID=A0ABU3SVG2_9ALTE|nr:DUF1513 domain-containing protein [Paraglaciecola aquimarina]MDU0354015.1 DUF1513 domain-containing protein [Paraglaciecola aquimarina]
MTISRRQFILGASQVALSAWLFPACTAQKTEQWLVSTCNDKQGQNLAVAINSQGHVISQVTLPARGHDSLALPHKLGHALVFARRPDRFAVEIDFVNGEIVNNIQSQVDSHFYGHGVFSKDGQYLYTTENQFDKKRGLIVVRDAQTYRVLDRFDSGGIGPHELALMPDGKTLVVANGGIETHPQQPRKKLNINNMRPNLAYVDIETGKVISSYAPPDNQLSLRHLTTRQDGAVFVGAQYQGQKMAMQPLVFSHHGENRLQAFKAPPSQTYQMQQYTASLLVKDNLLCVSCPRGSHLSFWDTATRTFISQQRFRDVSGLAYSQGRMLASSGKGLLKTLDHAHPITGPARMHTLALKFDNHMTMIEAG